MIVNPNVGGGGKQEAPVISVSSDGLITATANGKSATKQLSTQGAKTVTPTDYEQTVVAAGKYTTGAVKVAAMSLQPTVVETTAYSNNDTSITFEVDGITPSSQIISAWGEGRDTNFDDPPCLTIIGYLLDENEGEFLISRWRGGSGTMGSASSVQYTVGDGTITFSSQIMENYEYSLRVSFI